MVLNKDLWEGITIDKVEWSKGGAIILVSNLIMLTQAIMLFVDINLIKKNGKVVFGAAYLKVIWKSKPKIVQYGIWPWVGKLLLFLCTLCLIPFIFLEYPFTDSMSATFNVSMSAGYI